MMKRLVTLALTIVATAMVALNANAQMPNFSTDVTVGEKRTWVFTDYNVNDTISKGEVVEINGLYVRGNSGGTNNQNASTIKSMSGANFSFGDSILKPSRYLNTAGGRFNFVKTKASDINTYQLALNTTVPGTLYASISSDKNRIPYISMNGDTLKSSTAGAGRNAAGLKVLSKASTGSAVFTIGCSGSFWLASVKFIPEIVTAPEIDGNGNVTSGTSNLVEHEGESLKDIETYYKVSASADEEFTTDDTDWTEVPSTGKVPVTITGYVYAYSKNTITGTVSSITKSGQIDGTATTTITESTYWTLTGVSNNDVLTTSNVVNYNNSGLFLRSNNANGNHAVTAKTATGTSGKQFSNGESWSASLGFRNPSSGELAPISSDTADGDAINRNDRCVAFNAGVPGTVYVAIKADGSTADRELCLFFNGSKVDSYTTTSSAEWIELRYSNTEAGTYFIGGTIANIIGYILFEPNEMWYKLSTGVSSEEAGTVNITSPATILADNMFLKKGTTATDVTLTATANSGFTFLEWQDGAGTRITDGADGTNLTLTMDGDKTVKAVFEADAPATVTITEGMVELSSESLVYSGAAQAPTVTVKNGGNTLIADTDYTLTADQQTIVGSYTITVTGKGDYNGTVEKTWTITPKEISINYSENNITKKTDDEDFTNPLTNEGDGTITYTSSDTDVATVDSDGKVTIKAAGTTTITATATDKENGNFTYAASGKAASYTLTVEEATPAAEAEISEEKTWTFESLSGLDGNNRTPQAVTLFDNEYYLRGTSGSYYTLTTGDTQTLTFSDGHEVEVGNYLVANKQMASNGNITAGVTAGGETNSDNAAYATNGFAINTTVPGTLYAKIGPKLGSSNNAKLRIYFSDGTNNPQKGNAEIEVTSTDVTEISLTADKAGAFFVGGVTTGYSLYAVRFVPTTTKYAITCPSSVTGGTVTVDKAEAAVGETVKLTLTPDDDYQVGTVTVKTASGESLELGEDYSFVMPTPASKLTVEITFNKKETITKPTISIDTDGVVTITAGTSSIDGATIKTYYTIDRSTNEKTPTESDGKLYDVANKPQVASGVVVRAICINDNTKVASEEAEPQTYTDNPSSLRQISDSQLWTFDEFKDYTDKILSDTEVYGYHGLYIIGHKSGGSNEAQVKTGSQEGSIDGETITIETYLSLQGQGIGTIINDKKANEISDKQDLVAFNTTVPGTVYVMTKGRSGKNLVINVNGVAATTVPSDGNVTIISADIATIPEGGANVFIGKDGGASEIYAIKFVKKEAYALNITSKHGTVTVKREGKEEATEETTFVEGAKIELTAEAGQGYVFSKWTVNGEDTDTKTLSLTMNEAKTVVAVYDVKPAVMSAVTINQPYEGGTIKVMNGETEVTSGTEVADGTTLKVVATAERFYQMSKLVVTDADNNEIELSADSTFKMPEKAVTVMAVLVKEEVVTKAMTWVFNNYATSEAQTSETSVTEGLYNRSSSKRGGFTIAELGETASLNFGEGTEVSVSKVAKSTGYNNTNMTQKSAGAVGDETTPYFAFNIGVPGTCYAWVKGGTALKNDVTDAKAMRINFGQADGTIIKNKGTVVSHDSLQLISLVSSANKGTFFIGSTAGTTNTPWEVYAIRFAPTRTITVGTIENGAVKADKGTAGENETITLTITPSSGYVLTEGSVKVNGVAVEPLTSEKTGSVTTITFKMPDEDITVTAAFEVYVAPTYNITTLTSISGGNISASDKAAEGEMVTITVTPDTGMRLKSGTLTATYNDGSAQQTLELTAGSEANTYTFVMPAYAVTISAEFEALPTIYGVYDFQTWAEANISANDQAIIGLDDNGIMTGEFTPSADGITKGITINGIMALNEAFSLTGTSVSSFKLRKNGSTGNTSSGILFPKSSATQAKLSINWLKEGDWFKFETSANHIKFASDNANIAVAGSTTTVKAGDEVVPGTIYLVSASTTADFYNPDGTAYIYSVEISKADAVTPPVITVDANNQVTITGGKSLKGNDVKVYYTRDNTDPATSETKQEYSAPFTPTKTEIVRAYSVLASDETIVSAEAEPVAVRIGTFEGEQNVFDFASAAANLIPIEFGDELDGINGYNMSGAKFYPITNIDWLTKAGNTAVVAWRDKKAKFANGGLVADGNNYFAVKVNEEGERIRLLFDGAITLRTANNDDYIVLKANGDTLKTGNSIGGSSKTDTEETLTVKKGSHIVLQAGTGAIKKITVLEKIQMVTLTKQVTPEGAGTIVVSAGGAEDATEFVKDTEITLKANPNIGYQFDYWEIDGVKDTENTSSTLTLTMDADKTVKAVFTAWTEPTNEITFNFAGHSSAEQLGMSIEDKVSWKVNAGGKDRTENFYYVKPAKDIVTPYGFFMIRQSSDSESFKFANEKGLRITSSYIAINNLKTGDKIKINLDRNSDTDYGLKYENITLATDNSIYSGSMSQIAVGDSISSGEEIIIGSDGHVAFGIPTALTITSIEIKTSTTQTSEAINDLAFTEEDGKLAIETLGEQGSVTTIYYTTDGTEPTKSSAKYEAPFDVDATNGDITVKAIAYIDYLTNTPKTGIHVVKQPTMITLDVTTEPAEGGGTVTKADGSALPTTFADGGIISLKATPATGYQFVEWRNAEGRISTLPEEKFTVSENMGLKVVFKQPTSPAKEITGAVTWTFGDFTSGTVLAGSAIYEFDGLYISGNGGDDKNQAIIATNADTKMLQLQGGKGTPTATTAADAKIKNTIAFKAGVNGLLRVNMAGAYASGRTFSIFVNGVEHATPIPDNGSQPILLTQGVPAGANVFIGASGTSYIYTVEFIPETISKPDVSVADDGTVTISGTVSSSLSEAYADEVEMKTVYTTDGSEPSATNGTAYTEPFNPGSCTLKVANVNVKTGNVSEVVTKEVVIHIDASTGVPVILVAGQSNTDGRIAVTETAFPYNLNHTLISYCNGVDYTQEGSFTAYGTTPKSDSGERWGYDAIIYDKIQTELGGNTDFYVIKQSKGNTAINTMCSGNTLHWWSANPVWLSRNTSANQGGRSLLKGFLDNIDQSLKVLETENKDYDIKFLMWHQGEADRGKGGEYETQMKAVINTVRNYLVERTGNNKYSNLPIILGGIADVSKEYNRAVDSLKQELAAKDNNVYYAPTGTMTLDTDFRSDQVHFNATGAEKLADTVWNIITTNNLMNGLTIAGTDVPAENPLREDVVDETTTWTFSKTGALTVNQSIDGMYPHGGNVKKRDYGMTTFTDGTELDATYGAETSGADRKTTEGLTAGNNATTHIYSVNVSGKGTMMAVLRVAPSKTPAGEYARLMLNGEELQAVQPASAEEFVRLAGKSDGPGTFAVSCGIGWDLIGMKFIAGDADIELPTDEEKPIAGQVVSPSAKFQTCLTEAALDFTSLTNIEAYIIMAPSDILDVQTGSKSAETALSRRKVERSQESGTASGLQLVRAYKVPKATALLVKYSDMTAGDMTVPYMMEAIEAITTASETVAASENLLRQANQAKTAGSDTRLYEANATGDSYRFDETSSISEGCYYIEVPSSVVGRNTVAIEVNEETDTPYLVEVDTYETSDSQVIDFAAAVATTDVTLRTAKAGKLNYLNKNGVASGPTDFVFIANDSIAQSKVSLRGASDWTLTQEKGGMNAMKDDRQLAIHSLKKGDVIRIVYEGGTLKYATVSEKGDAASVLGKPMAALDQVGSKAKLTVTQVADADNYIVLYPSTDCVIKQIYINPSDELFADYLSQPILEFKEINGMTTEYTVYFEEGSTLDCTLNNSSTGVTLSGSTVTVAKTGTLRVTASRDGITSATTEMAVKVPTPVIVSDGVYDFSLLKSTIGGDYQVYDANTSAEVNVVDGLTLYTPDQYTKLTFDGKFAFSASKNWLLRNNGSLRAAKSNSEVKTMAILNVEAGQHLWIDYAEDSPVYSDLSTAKLSVVDTLQSKTAYEIMTSGHLLLTFPDSTNCVISKITIARMETVTEPSLTLKDAKTLRITQGSSSFGNSVTTRYTIDGSDPTAETGTIATKSPLDMALTDSCTVKAVTISETGVTSTIAEVTFIPKDEDTIEEVKELITINDDNTATLTSIVIGDETTIVNISGAVGDTPIKAIAENIFTQENTARVQVVDLSETQIPLTGDRESIPLLRNIDSATLIYVPATANVTGTNIVTKSSTDGSYFCQDYQLTDGRASAVPHPFTAENATLNREFTADKKCTVCLPYAFEASGGTFWEFTGISAAGKVQMTQRTGQLHANTPYIFIPGSGTNSITSTRVEVSMSDMPKTDDPANRFSFVGTYQRVVWEEPSGIYGFAAEDKYGALIGQFVRAGRGASIEPYRGYLLYVGDETLGDVTSARSRGTVHLPETMEIEWIELADNGGNTTGIDDRERPDGGSHHFYNLNGQRVDSSYRGLVIKNGKKMILK